MADDNNIDYLKLMAALKYYQQLGFQYVNLPWAVSDHFTDLTKPSNMKNFYLNDLALVGSGEQSFLSMLANHQLPQGRYVGITPCFRDEPQVDELHSKYFMKVELIDTLNINFDSLENIIMSAMKFFTPYGIECEIENTGIGSFDIIDSVNRIELGSYGIRQIEGMQWIFGTGCAEPRLTNIIKKL